MGGLHLRHWKSSLLKHLVVDQIGGVLVVGVSDSLGAVVAIAFGALLLEGSLVVLHSLA